MCTLVEVQMDLWPGSTLLSWDEFKAECLRRPPCYLNLDGSPIDWAARVDRYRERHPDALPYMTAGPVRYLGIRYGTSGSEYISNFPQEQP